MIFTFWLYIYPLCWCEIYFPKLDSETVEGYKKQKSIYYVNLHAVPPFIENCGHTKNILWKS